MQKFKHDCSSCKFLGNYFGFDVYYCANDTLGGLGTVIARHGDEGHEYASQPLKLLQDALRNPEHRIGGTDRTQADFRGCTKDVPWSMPYRDYVFSDRVIDYTKAMIVAIVAHCHELFR
jgi:hypothetical protein